MTCGLIGKVLGHSHSKDIHHMLGDYRYELLERQPDELEELLRDESYHGFNVTIPYKETVIPFCRELSPEAKRIGSVNTILRRADGGLYGHNTDLAGLCSLLARTQIQLTGKKVLILGSGGTSKTAQAACASLGASDIVVVSRSGPVSYDHIPLHQDAQILLNTTPVGMHPNFREQPVSLDGFSQLEGVVDVIYNPLRSRLVLEAEDLGIPCSGGLYMLAGQAVAAAELFTGESLAGRCEEIYETLRARLTHIVLVGMPGSGKTTVGTLLAEKTGRVFVDTDAQIVKETGMAIADIFSRYGEESFRALERKAIEDCQGQKGLVIATGGGAILDGENRRSLRQNGIFFYLKRELASLATENRPLSAGRIALRRMLQERAPLYERCADHSIDGNGTPQAVAAAILALLPKRQV